jgi:fructose transport system substrate-binding protein
MTLTSLSRPRRSVVTLATLGVLASAALSACGSDSGSSSSSGDSSSSGGSSGDSTSVSLITKDSTNPFFVAMQNGAKAAADAAGIKLTIGAGKEDGDEDTQIQLIENAIAQQQDGILITPNGPGVNQAMTDARDAGLYVIALDTPPDPPDTVDITFATDNREAGNLIGKWTAAQLGGDDATIALLDLQADKIVSVDYNRDQGFLEGMGIDVADPKKNGDEAETGSYSGGNYTIVCNEPTTGAEDGGRTAMENCLSQNPDINVVYTINEPSAYGADGALQAAGKSHDDILMVSVDGGCQAMAAIDSGIIDATSQQYPVEMAKQGVKAIATIAEGGQPPKPSDGLDFFNTGVKLVTNTPADGVESIDAKQGADICWGGNS